MKVSDLEAEALKLAPAERADLAAKLLESLETLSEEENELSWAEEAARRDAEIDADADHARPADEVFRHARDRLG
ncbi:MAG: addiction module protein [Deltaproteobacteria bacterium]|nr:addiction module protein [Deltaproteobacteria bacterium]